MNSCLNTFKIFYVNKFADHHLFANLSWEYHGMSFCNFSSFYRQVVDNRSKDPEQAPKMCAVWKTGTRWTVQKMASMWITAKWGPPSLSVSGSELIYEYHWISAQGYTSFWCQKKKNMCSVKALDPFNFWIWINEYAVILGQSILPWQCCLNVFTMHTIDASFLPLTGMNFISLSSVSWHKWPSYGVWISHQLFIL